MKLITILLSFLLVQAIHAQLMDEDGVAGWRKRHPWHYTEQMRKADDAFSAKQETQREQFLKNANQNPQPEAQPQKPEPTPSPPQVLNASPSPTDLEVLHWSWDTKRVLFLGTVCQVARVYGQFFNHSNKPIGNIRYRTTYYSQTGKILKEEKNPSELEWVIQPGASLNFEIEDDFTDGSESNISFEVTGFDYLSDRILPGKKAGD